MLHGSRILVGEEVEKWKVYLPANRPVFIITEEEVYRHYASCMEGFPVIRVDGGEKNKGWETVSAIVSRLIELEADRSAFIVGFGGGIVCDLAGFVASIYMRGCCFGFVPTTLLAQVDAAIGGKNGINWEGYKNILGTITPPAFVLCDPRLLLSLPEREYRAGLAEVVKVAMLADPALFSYMEEHISPLMERRSEVLLHLIRESVRIKVEVVSRDEREAGLRRLLNLGHTFAHVIERRQGLIHGEAVSIGLCMATRLSHFHGKCSGSLEEKICSLLEKLGLPTRTDIAASCFLQDIRKDKKREGEYLFLILPLETGRCEMTKMSFSLLEEGINAITR